MLVNEIGRLVAGALDHVEVMAEPPRQPHETPDLWRFTINPAGRSVVMKSGASPYFFELKQLVRDYCREKNLVVSEKFIDERVFSLLADSKDLHPRLPDIACHVKSWIDGIDKTRQDVYATLLPLNHYHFRGDVNTPHIKVVKITDKEIESSLCPIPDVLKDHISAKELAAENQTEVFAIARTRANDQATAVELAHGMAERFIYAVKLIDPHTKATLRKNYYSGVPASCLVTNKSKEGGLGSTYQPNELPNVIQRDEFYDKFNKTWLKLLDFLFDSHPTSLQKLIVDALYWYGEVDVHRHSLVSQYLYCLIGLEKLLVPKNEQQKAKTFGRNASILLTGSDAHAAFYEGYYKKRNSLIHEGPVMIYEEDANSLRLWLRSILLHLVDNTTKFIDLKSYYGEVHGIKGDWDAAPRKS